MPLLGLETGTSSGLAWAGLKGTLPILAHAVNLVLVFLDGRMECTAPCEVSCDVADLVLAKSATPGARQTAVHDVSPEEKDALGT